MYLEEKIGNPDLFTGRKKELNSLLTWIDRIKLKISKSKAIISRRKTGKSALMQRLYNLTFEKNDGVVPFYFEIKETDQWLVDFSREFFFTFLYQYIAFKTRNTNYLNLLDDNYDSAVKSVQKEQLDYLIPYIESIKHSEVNGSCNAMWNKARETPRMIAQSNNERIVQFIDEFQFINRYIYRDEACKLRINNLAGSYLHTAEYKNAPLLVSGSWVGWLMDDLNQMLPGRFIITDFGNISQDEAIEMIYKYSDIEKVPVNDEIVCIIAKLTEGNPFYISSLFQSEFPEKNFTSQENFLKTLNFEILDKKGIIKGTWMEYIRSAINRINDKDGKRIVLYICKNKNREVTRQELKTKLKLQLKNGELEERMNALVKNDIINQGSTDFDYQAVQDNIFDKVFRGIYQKEIEGFDPKSISDEYRLLYKKLLGKFNNFKGEFSEYTIINHLKYHAYKKNKKYITMIKNLPHDFIFVDYISVWSYSGSPIYKKNIQIDIFARGKQNDYSLIGKVKNRKPKFSLKEAKEFLTKANQLKQMENIEKAVICVFSKSGFYKNTISFLNDNGIAWTKNENFFKKLY